MRVPRFLVVSIVLSLVLTVALNLVLRLVPGATRRLDEWGQRAARARPPTADEGPRVRVIVPWRAMLVASIALTIVANLLLRW